GDAADRAEPEPQAAVATGDDGRHAVVGQRRGSDPFLEGRAIEAEQAGPRAEPEVSLLVLRDRVDAERERPGVFAPAGERVVADVVLRIERRGGSGEPYHDRDCQEQKAHTGSVSGARAE